jgi:hypothetical protein
MDGPSSGSNGIILQAAGGTVVERQKMNKFYDKSKDYEPEVIKSEQTYM